MNMRIPVGRKALGFLGSVIVRLIGATWRIEWRGMKHIEAARRLSPHVIYSLWHGRLLALSYSHRNRKIHVLASDHPDGDLMGKVVEWLGFGHLKGSSTRGGAKALRDLTSIMKDGYDTGLAVDGPRGPRGVVKQGPIELSRFTGCAVIPLTSSAKPRKLLRSWDRFQFPMPFARVIVGYGEPFVVPRRADPEERERLRLRLERVLGGMTALLDGEMGHEGAEVWPHEGD